ncbi:lyase family protein, partial [Actinotignum timonense]|uniref:lyase family protein n=1 Tax=Actinotignum timonense TaxID=1870995 RepID=UPI002A82310E
MTKDQLTGAAGTAAATQPAAAAQLTRTETDSMGPVEVPAAHYWGAQTARSLQHFPIGGERYTWGGPLIHAFGLLKGASARANAELGVLDPQLATLITAAASEVAEGVLDAEFPLKVFQTGSGTQTNMNVNEVIAARANEIATGQRGGKSPVHPNDHVNKGQSSNDAFPTAMYVAVARQAHRHLIPAVEALAATFRARASQFPDVVMVGRTHLQDATPIRWDQVVGSWAAQLEGTLAGVRAAVRGLYRVALGGT